MADSKITALTAISTVDPTADPLVIVDVSDTSMAASGTTKKSTINQLLGSGGTATLASATITGAASAAGLSVTGSTIPTNGVYLPSANNLGFAYNSTLGMTLNATGLGVGVASPAFKLQVVGTSGSLVDLCGSNVAGLQTLVRIRTATGNTNGLLIQGNVSNDEMYINNFYNAALSFGTNNTERLRIDATGNVGIGVTPSAWGNAYKVVQTGQALGVYGRSNLGYYGTKFNLYNDNTNDVAITTNYVGEYRFELLNGSHVWLNKSSAGTAGVNQTLTQAMTLDASGRLILLASTTTPATLSTNGQLTFTATSDTNLRFSYRGSDGVTRVANITLA